MPWEEGVCHLGDCLEAMRSMSDKSVDHVITDPPYEIEAHTGQVRLDKNKSENDDSGSIRRLGGLSFGHLSERDREEYAYHISRLSRSWLIVFCQAETIGTWKAALERDRLSRYKRTCIWVKPNAMPHMSGDRPAQGFESFVCSWGSPGRSKWNGGGKAGVYYAPIPRGKDRVHETQKPFKLMWKIVYDFTQKGDLILDPFAGSGTTLLAAKSLERRFIGFEKQENYCNLANERLKDPIYLPEKFKGKQLSFL